MHLPDPKAKQAIEKYPRNSYSFGLVVTMIGCIACLLPDCVFFFSSRRRHTRCSRHWSSDVCSSDLLPAKPTTAREVFLCPDRRSALDSLQELTEDRKSTRLNSSHGYISYAVFCL